MPDPVTHAARAQMIARGADAVDALIAGYAVDDFPSGEGCARAVLDAVFPLLGTAAPGATFEAAEHLRVITPGEARDVLHGLPKSAVLSRNLAYTVATEESRRVPAPGDAERQDGARL